MRAFVFALILFGAFALRLWNLDTQSLWHDEAWSVMSAYQPLTPIDPNYPPYFTVLLGGWIRLVGDSVWAMRYWSLLFGVATVAIIAIVARRWLGERAAIIAAILIAVSPILWVYSQEIRSYVLVPLLALVLLAMAGEMLSPHPRPLARRARGERRLWLWLALIEIILLYTHNLSVPIVAWLNVTVITALLFRRDWRRLRAWLLMQIGLLILYLPWLITQRPTGTPLNTPPTVSPALAWDVWQSYFTGIKAMVGAEPGLMALIAVFGVLGVAAIGAAVYPHPPTPSPSGRRGEKPSPPTPLPSGEGRTTHPLEVPLSQGEGFRVRVVWLVLSQAILIPIFEIIIILAAHIDFHPRYFIAGVPATLLLIAVGMDRLAQRGVVLRVAAVGAMALAVGIGVYMARLVYGNPAYQHDDFRAIAQHYAQLGPDDAIIIPYGWEPTLDYFSRKMNFKAKMIGIPLHSDTDTIIGQLRDFFNKQLSEQMDRVSHSDSDQITPYRVELLTWYQLPADVRGVYPCVFGVQMLPINSVTFSGLKSDSYLEYPSQLIKPLNQRRWLKVFDLQAHPLKIDFRKIQLLEASMLNKGDGKYCVVTRWQLPQSTTENVRISIRTVNGKGWELTRTDTDILNDNQLPTSFWQKGQTGTAFSLIKLPDGVNPLTSASAVIGAYSDETLHGFEAFQQGQSVGRDITIAKELARDIPYDASEFNFHNPGVEVGTALYLHRIDIPQGMLQPGQEFRVTLEWWLGFLGHDVIYRTLYLEGEGWQLSDQVEVLWGAINAKQLTWHQFTIPATARGHATLKVTAPNGKTITLAEYDITPIARTFTEPAVANRVSATFAGVGTLIGYTFPDTIKSGEALPITLYWKPNTTPPTTLKVFVHLLAGKDYSNGIIAQSDAEPAGGQRPTTSWVAGEYITDPHTLTFNNPGYTGPAALSIGLYDATTGKRVLLDNGDDHIVLPITILVK